ncbi:MAG: tyrosine-type recombinase/integrase [Nanoarchaeota archaeon]|nr:tyrosine-type recombinase/integrase [Nanoarchaeota archaeon]
MNILEAKKRIETELKIQGKSQRTVRMYTYFNEKFLEFIKKDIENITTEDVKAFLAELLSKGNEPSTVSLAKSALAFFYESLLERGIMLKIKTPKHRRKIPEVLTKEEVRVLIDNAGSLRNKLLLEFMYASGLRVSECASLKVNDINMAEKSGLLKHGKGGKDRFFILSEELINDLKEYFLEMKEEQEFLFPGNSKEITSRAIQDIVKRAAKRSGIKKHIYCHGLRHAFATHLLENGTDIRLIQELLAHSNLQTTQFYTQISKQQLLKVKSPMDSISKEGA